MRAANHSWSPRRDHPARARATSTVWPPGWTIAALAVSLLVLALAACSSGPSQTDSLSLAQRQQLGRYVSRAGAAHPVRHQ